ncbi:MAG: ribonuclease III [Rhodoluna sp.]|nr:ribonuclease III [Rhodoluna sp.]
MNDDVLSNRLGVDIEPQLLELALTHRSYAYENGNIPNNERLEFLGDSVLGFVVTAHIHDLLTDLPEGELTKVKNAVVSATALSQVASPIGLGEFLRLGKGEDQTGGREKPNLLADAFEAILGAAYVSKGLDAAEGIIRKLVFPLLEDTDSLRANSDPKTTLQERTQGESKPAPDYVTTHEGPDHDRTFFSTVSIAGRVVGLGQGRSKKLAETNAAIDALAKLPKSKKTK